MEKYDLSKIEEGLKSLDGWRYDNDFIVKEYKFKNFRDVISFMVRIGYEAEETDHHPTWTNTYKDLIIKLSTHSIAGITEKDFKMAKKIDELFGKR